MILRDAFGGMEVASPGVNGHVPLSEPLATVNPNVIVQHVVDLLEVTLGASAGDLEQPGSLLSDSKREETIQRFTRFACEAQVALYVQKTLLPTERWDDSQAALGLHTRHMTSRSR